MIPSRRSSASLVTFLIVLAAFLVFFLSLISPYLPALLMGAIFALLVRPVHNALLRRQWKRKTSAGLVSLAAFALIIVPIFSFATVSVKEGITIGQEMMDKE